MAFDTYNDLKTSIATWLAKDNLTDHIPDFIRLAESRIQKMSVKDPTNPMGGGKLFRVRQMETETTLSTASDSESVALPSDYLAARRVYVDSSPRVPLKVQSTNQIDSNYNSQLSGTPEFFAMEADTMRFSPKPNGVLSIQLLYYAKIPALSESNTTNWLLQDYPDIYLYASLIESAPFLNNDARVSTWKGLLDSAAYDAVVADALDRFSGSELSSYSDGKVF